VAPRWIIPVVALTAFGPEAARAQDSSLAARLDRMLHEERLVGMTWALVWPDSTRVGAAGRFDAPSGTVLLPQHRMQVGSVTKTLIATGILRLVTEGRLSLDQPVANLLPSVSFENPWDGTDPVRVRHLLDHTAGLDDARFWQVFSLKPLPESPLEEGIEAPLQVRIRPGTRMSYSNTGFTVAAMLIEAVTGERYEAWLDRNLLAPLGMTRSTFAYVTQSADTTLAMGHFENGRTQESVPTWLRPAGQFTTTASDMAALARFLMSDGSVGGAPFIDPTLLRAMGHSAGTEAREAGLQAGYALGLSTFDRYGARGLCHAGSTVGYRAMLCLFPETGHAFFSSHNADAEGAGYGRFDSLLVRELGIPHASESAPSTAADLNRWAGWYVRAPSRFAAFAWMDLVLGFATLRPDVETLVFTPFQGQRRVLHPVGAGLLRADGRGSASHVVYPANGTEAISDGLSTWERISLARLLAYWVSLALGLLGLAWILGAGIVRLVRRALGPRDPAFVPFLAVLALALPIPFLARQSFLALGDFTLGSALLATVPRWPWCFSSPWSSPPGDWCRSGSGPDRA
jgi:CubicO group peptidase (beta-lactamase class C family)